MQKLYCPQKIERIVQDHWNNNNTFYVTEDKNKEKYYCLSMMPYPSGNLHMGHVRNYTIGDVISRYQRMLGKNVLQPIGWDAFGLPAEQAAITNNTQPSEWTYTNIQYMKDQLKSLGFAYDWSREIITCKPQYYKWEQWFFTILYKKKLVYKKNSLVNWCPYHKTVLANEQVVNNSCWRCQATIQYKKMPQWFIKITDYANQLLKDLEQLNQWPEQVKTMQRNWIGLSKKIQIILKIKNSTDSIIIYVARLDNLMGMTYLTISTDHPIALQASKKNINLNNFIKIHSKSINEGVKTNLINEINIKSGIFTDIYAIHPITNDMLPIWVSNFVKRIEFNGLGAIGSCPAHNQQDWEFAYQYKLPIKPVIKHFNGNLPDITQKAMVDPGILFNSGIFDTLSSDAAEAIIEKTLVNQGIAKRIISYKLKDWCISRQRYWGVPIPMITLKNSMIKPVSINQLPVILPESIHLEKNIINPLKKNVNWIKTTYNDQIAFRETDTFDTFMESSWYYARYTCPKYNNGMLDSKAANYWLPIDLYIGGIEHATMHLIYFRFYHKLMRDIGLINSNEPAIRLLCQGMILSDSFYYLSKNGEKKWISSSTVKIKRNKKGNVIDATDCHGNHLIYAGMCKMSKSKNNGVDPNIIIQKYGADAVRFFIMFAAPVHAALEWKESGIEGAQRFLNRLWSITYFHVKNHGLVNNLDIDNLNCQQKHIRYDVHKTIMKVTDDIDRRHSFNTALSSIMILVNKLYQIPKIDMQDRAILQEALSIVIRLLYPFTPHISFVLWKALGNKTDIDNVSWPVADTKAIQDVIKNKKLLIIVQINGKMKKKIEIPTISNKDLIYDIAKKAVFSNNSCIKKQVKKIIYIPCKVINFII